MVDIAQRASDTSTTVSADSISPHLARETVHPVMDEQSTQSMGAFLYGASHQDAAAYIRSHAEQAIEKALNVDLHRTYIATRQVREVRIYKPIPQPPTTDSNASCAGSSEEACPKAYRKARVDFRAVTRVPGTIDSVVEMLAAEQEREAYWVALNTFKGFICGQMFDTERADNEEPFPRWSRRYMASRYSKYPSTKVVDACYAEYATYCDDEESDLRRAFVYRRSIDEQSLPMNEVADKMQKYQDDCHRIHLQDWLYEVAETAERHVCKVVLSCTVFLPLGACSPYDKTEFTEFCTVNLISLRSLLIRQWKEQVMNAVGSRKDLFLPWRRGSSCHTKCCGVCGGAFKLLRRRYSCHTCDIVMCSRCCVKTRRSDSVSSSCSSEGANQLAETFDFSSVRRRSLYECVLCDQFGCEGNVSRVSMSIRNQLTTSPAVRPSKMYSKSLDDELSDLRLSGYEELDLIDNQQDSTDDEDTHSVQSSKEISYLEPATTLRRCVSMGNARAGTFSFPSPRERPSSRDGLVLLSERDHPSLLSSSFQGSRGFRGASSLRHARRSVRAVSEDNVLLYQYDDEYDEDDLANFNLQLL